MTLSTLQGQNITVCRNEAQVFVNSAKAAIADMLTSNGVVHILDNVLNRSKTIIAPDPSAPAQAPAFAGVSYVADAPLTSGILPTATFCSGHHPPKCRRL
ncbi:hypothetical protein VTI74DRAFT_3852 [Chaetomium olivicolor]